jgi:hypothetical protein
MTTSHRAAPARRQRRRRDACSTPVEQAAARSVRSSSTDARGEGTGAAPEQRLPDGGVGAIGDGAKAALDRMEPEAVPSGRARVLYTCVLLEHDVPID